MTWLQPLHLELGNPQRMLTRDYILPNVPVADSRWWKCTPPDTVFSKQHKFNVYQTGDFYRRNALINQSTNQAINQPINQISQLLSFILYRQAPSSQVSEYALSGLTLQIQLGINTRKHSQKVQLFSNLVWCSLPIWKCAQTDRSLLFLRYLHLFHQSSCDSLVWIFMVGH